MVRDARRTTRDGGHETRDARRRERLGSKLGDEENAVESRRFEIKAQKSSRRRRGGKVGHRTTEKYEKMRN